MKGQRNYAPFAGLALGLACVVGYFGLVTRQDPYLTPLLEPPFAFLALIAVAMLLSAIGVWRACSARRPGLVKRALAVLLGSANLALAVLFTWYLFGYSYQLPAADQAPAVGSPAPLFSLQDQAGAVLDLASLRGRNVIILFYRGFW